MGFSGVYLARVLFGGRLEVELRSLWYAPGVVGDLQVIFFVVGVISPIVRMDPFLERTRLEGGISYGFVVVVKGLGVAWFRVDLSRAVMGQGFVAVKRSREVAGRRYTAVVVDNVHVVSLVRVNVDRVCTRIQ